MITLAHYPRTMTRSEYKTVARWLRVVGKALHTTEIVEATQEMNCALFHSGQGMMQIKLSDEGFTFKNITEWRA